MLGQFGLLPLLKGWEYKTHIVSRSITRGASPVELRISESGWLLSLICITDDANLESTVQWQGANLEQMAATCSAEALRLAGGLAQDPAGWLQRYFRPNPYSTAGAYLVVVSTAGLQGSALPYLPTIVMSVRLPATSTQIVANAYFTALVIVITNRELFIRSLRQVQDSNADLDIPKELLALGLVDLKPQESTNDVLREIRDLLRSQKR